MGEMADYYIDRMMFDEPWGDTQGWDDGSSELGEEGWFHGHCIEKMTYEYLGNAAAWCDRHDYPEKVAELRAERVFRDFG